MNTITVQTTDTEINVETADEIATSMANQDTFPFFDDGEIGTKKATYFMADGSTIVVALRKGKYVGKFIQAQ